MIAQPRAPAVFRACRLAVLPAAVLAVVVTWLPAAARQPGRPPSPRPTARLQVTLHENGIATLNFKFLHLTPDFELSDIVLHLEQDRPASPVLGQPLRQVEAAYYTLRIDHDKLTERDPTVTAKVHLYRDPTEPYTLADICLWYAVPNSRIELNVRPSYRNATGTSIEITTDPPVIVATLENRLTVRAAALDTKDAGRSDCESHNAKASN